MGDLERFFFNYNQVWVMRCISRFLAICLLYACTEKEPKEAVEMPNIIVIHVDDLGYTDVGAFGSTFYETPNIDKLALEGIRFENSYAAAAICSPTRAALITGKYPARLGLTDWMRSKFQGGIIPPDGKNPEGFDENDGRTLKTPKNPLFLDMKEKTIAEYLKPAGYYSGHIGKWHLGQEDHFPQLRGFDENHGGCDLGQPPSYFDPYLPANGNPEYIIPNLKPRKEGEYLTDREGDEAVDFVKRNKDGKFFLHWAPYTVHTPLQGKPELVEKYRNKQPEGLQSNPVYAAMIESLDDNVGKLVNVLDSLGISENTWVIFTSDNGGLLGSPTNRVTDNSPLRSGKGFPYEGGIRIPTIMKWPGVIAKGTVESYPIITMDILSTILDITGLEGQNKLDGASFLSLLKSENKRPERDLFWHFPHYRYDDVGPYTIIRSGDFKLIKYYDDVEWELYDLNNDPKETTNVGGEKADIVERLNQKIEDWVKSTGAKLPEPK